MSADAAFPAFTADFRPVRIVFGAGSIGQLPRELARLGFERPFVVTTPGRTREIDRVTALVGGRLAGTFRDARVHVPRELAEGALQEIGEAGADAVLTIGGGSATGFGKIAARDLGLPVVSVPTTYAGSEMTDTWGETRDGVKRTGRDRRVAPVLVVYDPNLTLTLPARVSAESGMNGVAHAVEALYAPDRSPHSTLLAIRALRQFGRHLPQVVREPGDLAARSSVLEAAHAAGFALGMTTMGLHHRLCHALGGALDLPHAITHAALLPHVVARNAFGAPEAMALITEALGGADAASAILALRTAVGLQPSLATLGVRDSDIDSIAATVAATPPANPVPVTRDLVRDILRAAL